MGSAFSGVYRLVRGAVMDARWWALMLAVPACIRAVPVHAALPNQAGALLPQLKKEVETYWPDVAPRAFLPALIEQESNWKLSAKLKTDREFGCGLGQFTVAYDKAGNVRFDALEEAVQKEPDLQGWGWKNCYEAKYQLRAVVLKLKGEERGCSAIVAKVDSMACAAARYNGGAGSVAKRIRICRTVPGCNPVLWYGNLERQCPQSRTVAAGYGESFCDINSKYPARVMYRMPKYIEAMK
jgi:hypothetical protein